MTLIEWVKNPDNITQGITVNSKTGCLNGCEYCYARKLANGRLKQRYLANKNYAPIKGISNKEYETLVGGYDDPFYPRWWPERLEQIRKRKKPTGIFLDDMSDWMGDYWPEEWTEAELQVMRDCPQHRFYTLTKQPQNLIKWSPFPDNCWVGVTVTHYDMMADAVPNLACIEASKRFISFEPLLERIPVEGLINFLDWVIIGSQTHPYKPPKIEWVEEIESACNRAGIPVFEKDNLNPLLDYNLRQEMPNG